MPLSHTAANIRSVVEEVLSEWDITHATVSATLTDNGSNIYVVTAFRSNVGLMDDDDDSLEGSDDEDDYSDSEPVTVIVIVSQ